jgi:hypothetical protein
MVLLQWQPRYHNYRMGGGAEMDRNTFTGLLMEVDNMSDAQQTMLYVFVRDARQNRAQARAMAKRQEQNAPPEKKKNDTQADTGKATV